MNKSFISHYEKRYIRISRHLALPRKFVEIGDINIIPVPDIMITLICGLNIKDSKLGCIAGSQVYHFATTSDK